MRWFYVPAIPVFRGFQRKQRCNTCSPQPTILRLHTLGMKGSPCHRHVPSPAKSNETLSPSTSGHAVARHCTHTRMRFAQHPPVRAFSRRPLQLRRRIFLQMFLQLRTHKAMPLPPIPCHPAMSPRRKRTPQNVRHSIGDHRAWFCTGRTGHRQSSQNHRTYHPHRRHQSTRRLAHVHQLQSRPTHHQILQKRARLVEKAYEILLRLLHHRVLPAYLS